MCRVLKTVPAVPWDSNSSRFQLSLDPHFDHRIDFYWQQHGQTRQGRQHIGNISTGLLNALGAKMPVGPFEVSAAVALSSILSDCTGGGLVAVFRFALSATRQVNGDFVRQVVSGASAEHERFPSQEYARMHCSSTMRYSRGPAQGHTILPQ